MVQFSVICLSTSSASTSMLSVCLMIYLPYIYDLNLQTEPSSALEQNGHYSADDCVSHYFSCSGQEAWRSRCQAGMVFDQGAFCDSSQFVVSCGDECRHAKQRNFVVACCGQSPAPVVAEQAMRSVVSQSLKCYLVADSCPWNCIGLRPVRGIRRNSRCRRPHPLWPALHFTGAHHAICAGLAAATGAGASRTCTRRLCSALAHDNCGHGCAGSTMLASTNKRTCADAQRTLFTTPTPISASSGTMSSHAATSLEHQLSPNKPSRGSQVSRVSNQIWYLHTF